jgi:hypothetical protein
VLGATKKPPTPHPCLLSCCLDRYYNDVRSRVREVVVEGRPGCDFAGCTPAHSTARDLLLAALPKDLPPGSNARWVLVMAALDKNPALKTVAVRALLGETLMREFHRLKLP